MVVSTSIDVPESCPTIGKKPENIRRNGTHRGKTHFMGKSERRSGIIAYTIDFCGIIFYILVCSGEFFAYIY